jgi:hypothetical protein
MAGIIKRPQKKADDTVGTTRIEPDPMAQPAKEARESEKHKTKAERISEFTAGYVDDKANTTKKIGPREAYDTVTLPLASIYVDGENTRTRHINIHQIAQNVLPTDHPDYASNQETIDGIVELAEHLKTEPLRQDYALYREKGRYYVAYGHRRHLALLLAFGESYTRTFKVYASKPAASIGMSRWLENSARENLPLHLKLKDFAIALKEYQARHPDPASQESVASYFGLKQSNFSVFQRAIENGPVMQALELGIIRTTDELKEVIKHKPQSIEAIHQIFDTTAAPKNIILKPTVAKKAGRPAARVQFPPIRNPNVFRMIIEGKLANFQWQETDFESFESMKRKLDLCLKELEKKAK